MKNKKIINFIVVALFILCVPVVAFAQEQVSTETPSTIGFIGEYPNLKPTPAPPSTESDPEKFPNNRPSTLPQLNASFEIFWSGYLLLLIAVYQFIKRYSSNDKLNRIGSYLFRSIYKGKEGQIVTGVVVKNK